jgi:hypothetical protein
MCSLCFKNNLLPIDIEEKTISEAFVCFRFDIIAITRESIDELRKLKVVLLTLRK